MRVLLFLLKNLGENKRWFYVVAITGVIYSGVTFLIPVNLADFANHPFEASRLTYTIGAVVSLYLVSLVTAYIIRSRGETFASNYANHIRLLYFTKLAALPLERLRKKHSGYVQSLVTSAAGGLSSIVFSIFWNLIPGIVVLLLFFMYMARESWLIAFVNIIILTVFIVASTLLARKMVPIVAKQNRYNAALVGNYVDFMANITTVSQLGVRPFTAGILKERVHKSNQQTKKLQTFHARRWFLLHSLFGFAYLSTIGFIIWQISKGRASAGLLILFVSAYTMTRGLIEQISENVKTFMEVRTYLDEIETFLGGYKALSKPKIKRTWHRIVLKDVLFNYPKSKEVIAVSFVYSSGSSKGLY